MGERDHSRSSTVKRAFSLAADPRVAAQELHAGLTQPDLSLVIFFCSPEYDSEIFAGEMHRLFSDTLVVGCTAAGEITPQGYLDNSVTGVSFARPEFEAVGALLGPLRDLELGSCGEIVTGLRHELLSRFNGAPVSLFATMLIDAMSRREEAVISCLGGLLADVPVVGGSAADVLRFERTPVYFNGAFYPDHALFVLVATTRTILPFRNQHFVASNKKLVVTGANRARRIVTELDAEPAVEAYARAIGYQVMDLNPSVFASYPLVVRLGGSEYVRSIQKANADGSLTFLCAIDEGLVLTLSEGGDILTHLEDLFVDIRGKIGEPEAIIGFDCVLRRLECERQQMSHRLSKLLSANNVVGFSTFGEQFGAMHVNQTFTGVAIGRSGRG